MSCRPQGGKTPDYSTVRLASETGPATTARWPRMVPLTRPHHRLRSRMKTVNSPVTVTTQGRLRRCRRLLRIRTRCRRRRQLRKQQRIRLENSGDGYSRRSTHRPLTRI
ncbi:unnamed protein product [Sphacelaria rigidula]